MTILASPERGSGDRTRREGETHGAAAGRRDTGASRRSLTPRLRRKLRREGVRGAATDRPAYRYRPTDLPTYLPTYLYQPTYLRLSTYQPTSINLPTYYDTYDTYPPYLLPIYLPTDRSIDRPIDRLTDPLSLNEASHWGD